MPGFFVFSVLPLGMGCFQPHPMGVLSLAMGLEAAMAACA
jgi:hypothetical protein